MPVNTSMRDESIRFGAGDGAALRAPQCGIEAPYAAKIDSILPASQILSQAVPGQAVPGQAGNVAAIGG